MSDKYDERIIITRLSERGISVKCDATMETIARSIIALFKELTNIDFMCALLLISGLLSIIEEKKEG